MNISAPFVRRPVATSLLAAALLLAGATGFTQLPVAPLPRMDLPTINVSASLPGASPETMATAVAMPLERRFGRIAGVTEITSTSSLGTTSITVQFDLDRKQEDAARDVQAAINAAGGDLPANLPQQPRYRKVNPADAPILILSLRSKTLPLPQVFEAANTILAQRISQVDGVGQVGVGGGVQPAVRVQVDPEQLAGLGLGLEDVRSRIATATANEPKGAIGAIQRQTVGIDDQRVGAAGWRDLVIHWTTPARPTGGTIVLGAGVTGAAPVGTGSTAGVPGATGTSVAIGAGSGSGSATPAPADLAAHGALRLGELARVTDDVENERVAGWFDGERTVSVIIRRQPGANILEVIDRIKAMLPDLTKEIPQGIDVSVAIDRSATIRASVHDVERALVFAIALVILVVLVFLRSGRATSIPTVVVPLSLIATFGVMYLFDYSLDNLSLMALAISAGFVVDDAIVVTENIARHIEAGEEPRAAALAGAREIGFTIVSITTSLLAVFIPLLFMGGLVGRLFREFAVTLAAAISLSAVISLTLTPMMASRLLRAKPKQPGRVGRALDRGLAAIVAGYGVALRFVLRHRIVFGLVTIGTIVATAELYTRIPFGLFPQQDTGMILGSSIGPQDISFPAMREKQEQLVEIVRDDPDVAHVIASIGGFGATTANSGSMFIELKDKAARTPLGKQGADKVIERLREQLAKVDGIELFLQVQQDLRVGGRSSRTQYQYVLQDANLAELNEWAPKITAALQQQHELAQVTSNQQTKGLQLNIEVDRDAAARFGITMAAIDATLYDAFGQRQVATYFTEVNEYRVVLEASPAIGTGPEALDKIYVPSVTGQQVPLSLLVHVHPSAVALSIDHQGQFPAVVVSFNVGQGVALGQAVDAIHRAMQSIHAPPSIRGAFSGTAQAFQDSLATEPWLVAIALLAVYIVLGVLYESYIHPITIMSSLIPAGLGALLALLVTNTDLSVMALIGILLLVGIVKKNAILMIDFAISEERRGKSPEQAIYEACMLRFRPIVMTTLAALLGALPLALGTGTGSELRRPLGISIIGGLAVSQLLTLFTTPVVYLALHRFARRRRRST